MTINEKLLQIQLELKVPKSKNNKFGGYKYRTAGMILEKVKPLTEKHKTVLLLQDDLVLMGDRYYVKSTAILQDLETNANVAISAYAREQLERKKSDDSQLTGAASTYARKYALSGLFLLDDGDDIDPDSYDDDQEELDRQEAEEQEQAQEEEKPKRRTRRSKKKEETIEDYMNPPVTEDGSEEVPFDEQDAKLKEDKFYFIEKDGNYIMKHAGEYPPAGGKEITKEEFVKGSAEIATGKTKRRRRKVRDEQAE